MTKDEYRQALSDKLHGIAQDSARGLDYHAGILGQVAVDYDVHKALHEALERTIDTLRKVNDLIFEAKSLELEIQEESAPVESGVRFMAPLKIE